MQNNLVSVIIPTYNRADSTLKNAVESAINQTYNNLEIIVVDDGSKDNTKEVLEQINDPRIIYIYQENAGPSAARNNGIRNAKGKYIALLDSDDLWLPEKIEKQVNIAESNQSIGMMCCFGMRYNPDTTEKNIEYHYCSAKNSSEFIEGLLFAPDKTVTGTSTMLFKREVFDKFGYFETGMRAYEDWDMFFKAALNYEFYCINEILVHKHTKGDSIRNSTDLEQMEFSRIKFLQNVFSYKNLPEDILRKKNKIYSEAYHSLGWIALYCYKNTSYSRKYLFISMKYSFKKLFNKGYVISLLLSFLPQKIFEYIESLKGRV